MSIINTQAGTGTVHPMDEICHLSCPGRSRALGQGQWSQSGHSGTCLTLVPPCCTHFTAPWCSVEIQPCACIPASAPCPAACAKGKAKLKRLWPSGWLPCPCDGDYTSARQLSEWQLKHIKLNSNLRQNTPSWRAERCRSCCLSCVIVPAVVEGQLPAGDGGDGLRDENCLGHLIWIPQSVQRELPVPSLALCSLLLPALPGALPAPGQQFQLESPGRRGCTFHGFGCSRLWTPAEQN